MRYIAWIVSLAASSVFAYKIGYDETSREITKYKQDKLLCEAQLAINTAHTKEEWAEVQKLREHVIVAEYGGE